MKGGKVIASGTYGCIFDPPLKCKNKDREKGNYVSKLMSSEDADEEMSEIKEISKLIKKINNNDKYFILNKIYSCYPDKLEYSDLDDFNTKCHAMVRRGIVAATLDDSLNFLKILQLPHGGKDISYFFNQKKISNNEFIKINESLIKLLDEGITKLKLLNILHFDIKSLNIVYSEKENLSRLIDWGISFVIKGNMVPNEIRGWTIMFNQPFTNLVFNKNVQLIYKSILNKENFKLVKIKLRENIFKNENTITGIFGRVGHLEYLTHVFNKIRNLNIKSNPLTLSIDVSPENALLDLLSEQLAHVLIEYSNNNGVFNEKRYFNEIYRHNCDIYGFLISYIDILTNINFSLSLRVDIFELLYKYCFNYHYCLNKYPINLIINDLKNLNTIKTPKTVIIPGAPRLILESNLKKNLSRRNRSTRKRRSKKTRKKKK